MRHEHVIFAFGMCDLVNQNETDSVRIMTNGLQKWPLHIRTCTVASAEKLVLVVTAKRYIYKPTFRF